LLALYDSAAASVCVIPIPWFCQTETPTEYAPMRAPFQDPRFGPVWTPNGWSYPEAAPDADAPPVWAHEAPAEPRPGPGPERRLK
jgi:hypothetical protein